MSKERYLQALPTRPEFDEHKRILREHSKKIEISGGVAVVFGLGGVVFPPLITAAQMATLEMTKQVAKRGIEVNQFLAKYPVFDR